MSKPSNDDGIHSYSSFQTRMKRVLIIGQGGREHALAKCFKKSPTVSHVFVAPGNAGMNDVAQCIDINIMDFKQVIEWITQNNIDLVFVGPEAPLSAGIVDALEISIIKVFGPKAASAQLESSKSFAKSLMQKYHIPTADYVCVNTLDEGLAYLNTHPAPIVIKADGLMAGKGVVVAMSDSQANEALHHMFTDQGVEKVVIEEYLEGEEFSLMAFVHHDLVLACDVAKDYKRAYDQDLGPNTGGMGAYSPVPLISKKWVDEAIERVMIPMAKAMVNEGIPFTGVLYGGLMVTKQGVKTIEFNVRFGDPEAEVLLARLMTPIDQVIDSVMQSKAISLEFDSRFALGVVMASKGYPQAYQKGFVIKGLDQLNCDVCHMGTAYDQEYINVGGRVLFVMDLADSLQEARVKVYDEIKKIQSDGLFYRSDIGLIKETNYD
jgi:phosphoribosylamine---glycine ligase